MTAFRESRGAMRGLWRPMVVYGAASVLASSVLFLGSPTLAPAHATLFALGLVPVPLFLTLRGVLPVNRFLAGLTDAGLRWQIVDDVVGWRGDRRVTLRTPEGVWHLASRNLSQLELHVRGPHLPRRAEIRGDWRRAGRMAARVRMRSVDRRRTLDVAAVA